MSEPPNEETEAPKKKPVLLIVIVANVLLGGGAAAFFFLRGGGDHAKAAGHEAKAEEHLAMPQPGAVGPIVEMKPILVNLNEPEGTRYLKATIAIQLANEKLEPEVKKREAVIQDHFLRTLSDLTFRQTMGNKNKLAIKQKLLERFNDAMGTQAGTAIHFTQFVVQ
ncbi:MAG: flagellar basal body protein FliL [Deltaproteobacteria bacterium]|nr:MAG: flagellar basal body protein FliL [Deltaproteobacteria bacterium]